jgi:hypothetical protein
MTHSTRPFALGAASLALSMTVFGLCALPAHAQTDAMSSPAADSGSVALAAAKERARALRAHAAGAPGRIDTTPPQLHGISTTGSVNAAYSNQRITVDLDIRDDLSGVASYYIEYVSPSKHQRVWRLKTVATPLLHVTPTLTIGSPYSDPGFTAFDEPGSWEADYLYVFDAAGNEREYFTNGLANLGYTWFQVTNSSGWDNVPPSFASGTIETPTIKRSKAAKGTKPGTPPYVSANLSVTDSGNGVASGNFAGTFTFCHLDAGQNCDDTLILQGTTNQAGEIANTITVGTQMRADQTLGQYVIKTLDLYDIAGNSIEYKSTQFGGSTNFASYFPQGTTIFINQ